MRRVWFALAVVVLLATGQAAYAVDLQEGWYARYEYVTLRGMDSPYNEWGVGWYPTTPLGQTGYLLTQEGRHSGTRGRTVTITENVSVDAGVIYEDVGTYFAIYPYFQYVTIEWDTNYNSNNIQLQIFRRSSGHADELVWTQSMSGSSLGGGNIWGGVSPLINGEQVVFKLVVVPELSSVSTLASCIIACFCARKRMCRR